MLSNNLCARAVRPYCNSQCRDLECDKLASWLCLLSSAETVNGGLDTRSVID